MNPWSPNYEKADPVPLVVPNRRFENLLQLAKRYWSLGVVLLVALSLIFGRERRDRIQEGVMIQGLASKVPVFKGEFLEKLAIEEISLPKGGLSKNQAWSLVQLSLENLSEEVRIRAKKDIPPRKPILWNEIEIVRSPTTAAEAPSMLPKIIYSQTPQAATP